MIDIRKQTLETLGEITLPDFLKYVNIVLSIRHLDNTSAFSQLDGYFALDNGININISKDTHPFKVEFVGKDTEVHDVTKWFAYKDYTLMQDMLEYGKEEKDLVRQIDLDCFNVFIEIVTKMKKLAQSLSTQVLPTTDRLLTLYNGEDFVGIAIAGRYRAGGPMYMNNVYSQSFTSIYEIEKFFNYAHDVTSGYALLTKMFSSLVIESTPVAKWNHMEHNRRDFFSVASRDIRVAVPASFLKERGAAIVECSLSGDAIIADQNSHTILPRSIFGSTLRTISAKFYVSNERFEEAVNYDNCDHCSEEIQVIDSDFVDDVLDFLEGDDYDNIKYALNNYYNQSRDFDTDGLCNSCYRREQETRDRLERIGIKLEPRSRFSYRGKSYNLFQGSAINEYDYTPHNFEKFYLPDESPTDLMLGVELEIDEGGKNQSSSRYITAVLNDNIMDEYTYSMHDGSLDQGFEIATMPSSLLFHMNKVNYQDGFRIASALGYRSHDTSTCGLHVHMSRRFFGATRATQNIKAAFMALILERNWDEVVKFSRRNYHHIEEWANKKGLEYEVDDYDTTDDIASKFLDSYDDKYVALNTQHSNSFELRIFRGTLRYETYIATLQFVSNLAHIAKSCTTLTRAQQITFKDIINYQRYPALINYLSTRGMSVEANEIETTQAQPTLFDAVAQ